MKTKKFWDPVYRFELLFITDCSWKKASQFVKKYGIPPFPTDLVEGNGASIMLTEKQFPKKIKGSGACIWVENKKDFYCLMHEISHIVIEVFEMKGMKINNETTEAVAYYFEYWFREL